MQRAAIPERANLLVVNRLPGGFLMKRTSMIAAAMGTAAVLGLAGTAMAANAGGSSAPATVKVSPASDDNGLRGDGTVDDDKAKTSPSKAPASSSSYDRSEASRAALRATGGGKVTKIEAEYEHGRAVWKVRIVKDGKRHDLYVDRKSGKVTRHDVKSSGGSSSKATSTRTVVYGTPKGKTSKAKHGDDHRGRGRGSDDKGRDDRGRDHKGRGGHGKDDKGRDDHGRGGHGKDDKGGDDKGRGGHGKDDKGSDDHGGRGRGSDD
jgi:uncharacterized membrane protein YkoI